jgi:hypothetical protein
MNIWPVIESVLRKDSESFLYPPAPMRLKIFNLFTITPILNETLDEVEVLSAKGMFYKDCAGRVHMHKGIFLVLPKRVF